MSILVIGSVIIWSVKYIIIKINEEKLPYWFELTGIIVYAIFSFGIITSFMRQLAMWMHWY